MHFVDPTTNMRVNTGPEFKLSLRSLDNSDIPGVNVVLSAMGLVTKKTRVVSLRIHDANGTAHIIALERVSHSVFNVQETAHGRIAQILPVRIWINGFPVAGYKATRDGWEIPMHDVDFVPYRLVVPGIDSNDVQAVASALWSIQLDVKHIEVCMGDSMVRRTHIRDARFRMTAKDSRSTRITVRVVKGIDDDLVSILNSASL